MAKRIKCPKCGRSKHESLTEPGRYRCNACQHEFTASDGCVRVFISSTFKDMHAERDHLVTVVFPELRQRCERLGLEFYDVDLRWGVPDKTADNEKANSWEYCRKWIDRVEPFFICMLGQRYGYQPKPDELKDAKDPKRQAMEQERQRKENQSITEMEIHHAVFSERLNRRCYFYLRKTTVPVPDANASVEQLERYSDYVDGDQAKLAALKERIRKSECPVRDYDCAWTGDKFSKLEKFGNAVLQDLWSGILRDKRYVPEAAWQQVLKALPDANGLYTSNTATIPATVWEELVKAAKPPIEDLVKAERDEMDSFADERLRWFKGRTRELKQLKSFICSTDEKAPRLAVVAALPGQGKSALMAQLDLDVREGSGVQKLDCHVITHFVGATEASANVHSLVKRLLDELETKYSGIEWPVKKKEDGKPEEESKQDFNSLCNRLADRLRDYSGGRRIVILLDALNQLTDGHELVWLPRRLGPSVRIVVSCIRDPAAANDSAEFRVMQAVEARKPDLEEVPLGGLDEADVHAIVTAYLLEYCKELDAVHVNAICDAEKLPQARNPLYLLVMLAELRTLGGNEMNKIVPSRIASMSSDHPDTVSLFEWVLARMEQAEGFGREAVQWWCVYLAHGRAGMASHELADLLARKLGADDAEAAEEAKRRAQRIERGIRRYLQRRGRQFDFFHGQLRQAVERRYGSCAPQTATHHEIADYFTAEARGTDAAKAWETDCVRGFSESVFHHIRAADFESAGALLTTFPFLLHKIRNGLLEGVFEDYALFNNEAPQTKRAELEIWTAFFREKAHILRRGNEEWPSHKSLLQLAVEHADDSPLTIAAEKWLAEDRCDWLWLRRVPRLAHVGRNPCITVFEGHSGSVTGALVLADGRILSWSSDGPLRLWDIQTGQTFHELKGHSSGVNGASVLADGKFLSWSDDNTLRLWGSQTGQPLHELKGHSYPVRGALELADGRILSWSHDDTLRLWDGETGQPLQELKGHSHRVNGALALVDGRILSWSHDKTLRLWDGQTGQPLHELKGHSESVEGSLVLADGRILSWSHDKTLRLWDGQMGQSRHELKGHSESVKGSLVLADGRILSWSHDHTPRLWDGETGQPLQELKGHSGGVDGALALADGRILSWSYDGTLRLWDEKSGQPLHELKGHSSCVYGALALDGSRILSWSFDKTLRLWDGKTGLPLHELKGHSGGVYGALALADGPFLSWSGDATLRLWDGKTAPPLHELEGHSDLVNGALALADGRILSWSHDNTLRLWDGNTGQPLHELKGHLELVNGALALADGRILSWSNDETLRLWDGNTGQPLHELKGHSDYVIGSLALAGSRILSWSDDNTLRLWDGKCGECIEVVAMRDAGALHPEWLHAIKETWCWDVVCMNWFTTASAQAAHLRNKVIPRILAAWQAESDAESRILQPDGTVVVTQQNGQVCILKLHHGQRRVSLAEAEELLPKLYPEMMRSS